MTPGARTWLPSYLILALIWGFSFYFIIVGLEAFTPVGVAFSRIAFGAITLIIIALATRTSFAPKWAWKYLFVTSLLWVSIPWMLFGFAETQVSSALAGIINGATPLMTLLAILVAFPEEKPTLQRILGLFIGFAGIIVVVGPWQGIEGSDALGIAALVLAIACYGIAFPFARRYLYSAKDPDGNPRPPLNPIALALAMMVWGLVITGPIVLITGVTDAPMSSAPFFAVAALGILGSGIAYVLNFRVVQRSDATTASTVTYFTPLVAVIAGAVLLGEHLSWNQPVGGVIVVLGAAIAQGVLRVGSPRSRTPHT